MMARAQAGDFDAYAGGLEPGGVEPHGLIYEFFATSGERNYGGYSSPRMNYVLNNTLRSIEPKARAVSYRAAQQIIQNDRPAIILYNETSIAGVSASVTGVELLGNGSVSVSEAQYK